jgi:hypothetical protein
MVWVPFTLSQQFCVPGYQSFFYRSRMRSNAYGGLLSLDWYILHPSQRHRDDEHMSCCFMSTVDKLQPQSKTPEEEVPCMGCGLGGQAGNHNDLLGLFPGAEQ